ncbi:MAG: carboxypeptidase regulatory-like domain-containing protein [Myxococcales bacterium]|nr:carboxypeptidase regulatory-like domain-containing protein [Myxococcales bacterium]
MIRPSVLVSLLIACAAFTSSARADRGLTALGRVRPVGPGPTLSAALASGYGFTGDVLAVDDSHHRASGALAIAVRAVPWLELTGSLAGRYDRHTGGVSDDGFIGDPRIGATAGGHLDPATALGVRLGVWLPGADAPSIEFGATTLDASLVLTRRFGASALTVSAGYRLDRSTESVDAATLTPADRLGLGLSDADAALVGVGLAHQAGATQLFGELSGEVLVGAGAPAALESPLRAGVGVRRALDASLTFEALAEIGLSQRPDLMAMAPDALVDVEPRLAVAVGLSWRPAPARAPVIAPPPPPPVDDTPPPPPPPPAPTTGPLTGRVTDAGGAPLPDVTITVGATTVLSGEDGGFTIPDLPIGPIEVAAARGGYESATATATIVGGTGATVELTLARVQPKSQIRGVVRDFNGKGLAAKVTIDPLGAELTSNADGTFVIDVPPGTYTVTVALPGYRAQKKTAVVVEGGVPILNIELVKGRK